ncbi:MAG: phosphoribosylaminoimidazolesuccinocarboxamide synthase [Deltaproteobacteria bacterium CG11_big_fil_rev_8_21_14_0_20_42_23]|nr:MAG: phosphoribosylaminoimidazolesuccinocarboxamide synthase [Deltaproteobacteria bacterium CG11_big_fil_rev_8_21_14_0_20_42_23]PJC65247.1 MAG: phosphoribosylaminoimidazolesuccinocarboxamide synthase [Deltaproteobacteria bacterium CG_4_9_14_0_2_um_filter_42_21]
MSDKIIHTTHLQDMPEPHRGKVRDIYDLGNELLIVTTDRISAFDVVLPTAIPRKGEILTEMSRFWFRFSKDIIPNHLSSTQAIDVIPNKQEAKLLGKRAIVVKKAKPLPIEAIVRGYVAGSAWKDYQKTGKVCGITLPHGLKESSALEHPLFTPSTKANIGEHDENISFTEMVTLIGQDLATQVRDVSLQLYKEAAKHAKKRGIIIADTKFEFGIYNGKLILIDEVLTPDSSRFWPAKLYEVGRAQMSFDKQFVRDYLETLSWNKKAPGPKLPDDVVKKTQEKYEEALTCLTE